MRDLLALSLLLCAVLCPGIATNDQSAAPASLVVTFPAPHSWWQASTYSGLLLQLPVHFQTHNFHIPEDGFLRITGSAIPDGGYRHNTRAASFVLGDVDPGTHFWKLELVPWNHLRGGERRDEETSVGPAVASVTLHAEVVVDPRDVRSPWFYALQESDKKPQVLVNLKDPRRREDNSTRNPAVGVNHVASAAAHVSVCYVTSTSGPFDGQKKMWLQIMENLGASDVSLTGDNRTARFEFAVKVFEGIDTNEPLAQALARQNVSLDGFPLEIPKDELLALNIPPDNVREALLSSFYDAFPSAKLSPRSVSPQDCDDLPRLQPPFAARFWTQFVDVLRSPCADGLVVFANSRSPADEMLILASRLAGARAVVMELTNLYPMPMEVDVLLGPSHFALRHYSVAKSVRAQHKFVLSAGIDTLEFTPSSTPQPANQGFVIGYMGRLSSEKSLGVLLAAMKNLKPRCPQCRLRIVGDGPQRSWLEALAKEWGLLDTALEFVGAIYNDERALVKELRAMHVFASPMFSETLGIAVLEAMSVGLPVVGFISSGTSEFLEDEVNCVAVPEPTPQRFADTLLSLVIDPEKRHRLGQRARWTVEKRFSPRRALQQVRVLYERVHRPLSSSTRSCLDDADLRMQCGAAKGCDIFQA